MKGAQNKQQKTKTALKKKGFSHSPPVWNCTQVFDCFSYIFSICVEWKKGWIFVWLLPVHLDSKVQSFSSARKYFSFCLPTSLELCFSLSRLYSFVSSRLLNNLVYLDFKSRFSLIVLVHLCQVCSSSRVFIVIDMAFLNLITLWSIDELKIRSLDETNYKIMKFRWTNTLKSR